MSDFKLTQTQTQLVTDPDLSSDGELSTNNFESDIWGKLYPINNEFLPVGKHKIF
jgi:hypothetical protein